MDGASKSPLAGASVARLGVTRTIWRRDIDPVLRLSSDNVVALMCSDYINHIKKDGV